MIKNRVLFSDLKKINSKFKKKFLVSLSSAIDNSNFIKGEQTKILERKINKIFDCKYSLTVNSGTDALIVGIKSLNLKPGSEIITTSNTWISSAYAIELNNCKPIFVDVNSYDFQIDTKLIEKEINKNTKAILITHLYGMPCDMKEIVRIVKKYNLFLIEDIAQAHLAKYKNKIVGNFGDIACLSFYPTKNLGALGDGGAILTNSKKFYLTSKSYANYGSLDFRNPDHKVIGINSRLDEIQAYFLVHKINNLKKDNNKRLKIAKIYQKKCDQLDIKRIQETAYKKSAYHLFPIIVKKRNEMKKFLKKNKIDTKIHYEIPIHLQGAFFSKTRRKYQLPVTEYLSKNMLSIPFYPDIEKKKINYIFKKIKEFIS